MRRILLSVLALSGLLSAGLLESASARPVPTNGIQLTNGISWPNGLNTPNGILLTNGAAIDGLNLDSVIFPEDSRIELK